MNRRPALTIRPRRGFAVFTAVILIAFIGALLLAMTSLFSFDAKRTERERAGAQLRQLLLAGADQSRARLAAGATDWADAQAWDVPLPAALADRGAALRATAVGTGDGQRSVRVEAALGSFKAAEVLTFERGGDGKWAARAVSPPDPAP